MAQRAKVSPLRISFHIASIALLNLLRFDSLASAGNLPKHLESLMEKSNRYVIPERRVRSYPRVVKENLKIPKKKPVNLLTDWH